MPTSSKKRRISGSKGVFREVFVSANRELAPFGITFIYEPENFEYRKLGTVFGVIKISDTSPESSFIANLLASVIKKEYFSKPDRPAYDSFEASLKKANLALAELVRQGSVKWIDKISFAGGAIEKNNLHFSKLGAASVLLLRNGALADIGSNINTGSEMSGIHPLKTFSDISSGKIEQGDCLIFTTSDLLEIFSLEEIRQNAARFSREEFPDILSASLATNSELSGLIVVNIVPEEAVAVAATKSEEKPLSFATENQFLENISQPQNAFPSSPSAAPGRIIEKETVRISEYDEIIPRKSFVEKISLWTKSARAAMKNTFIAVFKNINRAFIQINWEKISFAIKKILNSLKESLKESPRFWATVGTVSLLAIIFIYFNFFGDKNIPDQSAEISPPAVAPVSILDDINTKSIENISEVAALPADNREIIFLNDFLFCLNADKFILKINSANGETEKIESAIPSGKFTLAAAMPDLGAIFILTEDKKIISFTPNNKKFQENSISVSENLNAADMKTYLTYLYILDPAANQIYRYPRAEGGFGEQQNWLKTSENIENSIGFAINEDLFIATKNQITAYFQGKKDDKINFENPKTALAIDKIFTAPDMENIYILDNKNHRFIQYSKDGKILTQYFNQSLAGIENFTVDEKNKTIYLQKANSILKFSME